MPKRLSKKELVAFCAAVILLFEIFLGKSWAFFSQAREIIGLKNI